LQKGIKRNKIYIKIYSKAMTGLSKAVNYPRDGKGRDSYISFNNGGLGRPGESNIYEIGNKNISNLI
jgi:hypothetical protein